MRIVIEQPDDVDSAADALTEAKVVIEENGRRTSFAALGVATAVLSRIRKDVFVGDRVTSLDSWNFTVSMDAPVKLGAYIGVTVETI